MGLFHEIIRYFTRYRPDSEDMWLFQKIWVDFARYRPIPKDMG